MAIRLVPLSPLSGLDGGPQVMCGNPMQVVLEALGYFNQNFAEPDALLAIADDLGISDDCLDFSFDQVRGMTPAEALLDHRLNKLFVALTDQPRQGLGMAIKACGLGHTRNVVRLFESAFGIEMPLFLLTCRRAAEDRQFRVSHPDDAALVLHR